MLEQVDNPLRVFFVGILFLDCLDKLRVTDYHMARILKNILDRKPIFLGGFHANVFTSIYEKPVPQFAQILGVGRKPARLIFRTPTHLWMQYRQSENSGEHPFRSRSGARF